jgi:hypothetical protein
VAVIVEKHVERFRYACFLGLSLANQVSTCSLELAGIKKKEQEKGGMRRGACLYKNTQKPLAYLQLGAV